MRLWCRVTPGGVCGAPVFGEAVTLDLERGPDPVNPRLHQADYRRSEEPNQGKAEKCLSGAEQNVPVVQETVVARRSGGLHRSRFHISAHCGTLPCPRTDFGHTSSTVL